MEVKDFFNLYWKQKHLRWFDRYYDFLKIINEDVFKKLSVSSPKKILAVGIGETRDIDYFNKLREKVITVDISFDGLKRLKRFERIQMDVNEMGFKKESFNIIFLRTVMLHLDHKKVLLEIKRVLKKNGRFFWIEPMKDNIFLWLYRYIISPGRFTRIDYLTYREVLSFRFFFKGLWHREYFFFTVLLIPLYVFLPQSRRFILMLQKLEMRIIDRYKWLRRFCWISYGCGEI
ncbi:MAG: class I SAM-dependent methyltransferase [Candidatus Cloacimonadota bacterium]|nr:MAG: class I SAM-dependent methyltransferase [Candidatus Cloacimonadota bacterium]